MTDIILTPEFQYTDDWIPTIGEELEGIMEPLNPEDPYAVCVKRNGMVVGHLEKGVSETFSRTVFFFLRADRTSSCEVTVTGSPVNLGDGKGQKVPCQLRLRGNQRFTAVLQQQLIQ